MKKDGKRSQVQGSEVQGFRGSGLLFLSILLIGQQVLSCLLQPEIMNSRWDSNLC
jgi:hypothetical protein